MAEVNFGVGLAVGEQTAFGLANINTTIRDLVTDVDETEGGLLGDPSEGIGDTGFSLATERVFTEKAVIPGSFTRPISNRIGTKLASFTIAIPLQGNGIVVPGAPVDADATPLLGVRALLRACGLTGAAWGTGVGWRFAPAAALPATAKMWLGTSGATGLIYVLYDVVGSVTFRFRPGEHAVAVFEMVGEIHTSFEGIEGAVPTFTLTNQVNNSAPGVSAVAHNWGIGGALRDYTEIEIAVSSEFEEVPSSNSATGKRSRQTGREITVSGTIVADDADDDYEPTALRAIVNPTDLLTFQVGTNMATAAKQNAYSLNAAIDLRNITPAKVGAVRGWEIEGICVSGSANSEFELIFR